MISIAFTSGYGGWRRRLRQLISDVLLRYAYRKLTMAEVECMGREVLTNIEQFIGGPLSDEDRQRVVEDVVILVAGNLATEAARMLLWRLDATCRLPRR